MMKPESGHNRDILYKKMRKIKGEKILISTIILIIVLSVIWYIGRMIKIRTFKNNNVFIGGEKIISAKGNKKIKLGKCRFAVEFAINPQSRQKGLSGRKKLCNKCGMFFEFSQKGRYGFWMKGMLFPIDLIWLQDDKVVGWKKNFSEKSHETIFPPEPINQVLEINAGKVEKCGIKIGEYLR